VSRARAAVPVLCNANVNAAPALPTTMLVLLHCAARVHSLGREGGHGHAQISLWGYQRAVLLRCVRGLKRGAVQRCAVWGARHCT
jgi:hypothetical protein